MSLFVNISSRAGCVCLLTLFEFDMTGQLGVQCKTLSVLGWEQKERMSS